VVVGCNRRTRGCGLHECAARFAASRRRKRLAGDPGNPQGTDRRPRSPTTRSSKSVGW